MYLEQMSFMFIMILTCTNCCICYLYYTILLSKLWYIMLSVLHMINAEILALIVRRAKENVELPRISSAVTWVDLL